MGPNLVVRAATLEERGALWDWFNEPLRAVVFRDRTAASSGLSYATHRQWYERKVLSGHTRLFVGLVDILRVGMVRFDLVSPGVFEAKLCLKPAYSGLGYAPLLLKNACARLAENEKLESVSMKVRAINPASRAAFTSEGFQITEETPTHFRVRVLG